jgi:benzodiazapine receptor
MTTHSPMSGRTHDLLALIGLVGACFVVAALGGLATSGAVDGWYAEADTPWFTPPNGVFGPVWTVLYAAMGVAAWLVWRRGGSLVVWWVQLALNLAWTPTFFGAELLWPAVAVIVALDVAVAVTLLRFLPVSRLAAALFVPYLVWVLYATALNVGIAALN